MRERDVPSDLRAAWRLVGSKDPFFNAAERLTPGQRDRLYGIIRGEAEDAIGRAEVGDRLEGREGDLLCLVSDERFAHVWSGKRKRRETTQGES